MASKDITFQVRSDEQMLFLLKMVDVNQIETKRRNVNVRHKIWKGIAEKLNRLAANGAEKDCEGWKRCFKNWCISAGTEYKSKMQELIRNVPHNGNYLVDISEEDVEEEEEVQEPVIEVSNPVEKQKQQLHQLVLKHQMLLLSTADDEPLKTRLWKNIADQLNAIEGGHQLTPMKWKKKANLHKYRTHNGKSSRKGKKATTSESNCSNSSYSHDDSTQASSSSQGLKNGNTSKSNSLSSDTQDKVAVEKQFEKIDNIGNSTQSDAEDKDLSETEPETKRIKPSPLVKNFKFSNRMVSAVEELRDDVKCVNSTLQQTTESLNSIRNVLERQCEQQEELNALLKRSTQLLKVLVEFKIGKHTSANKRNFYIHETDDA